MNPTISSNEILWVSHKYWWIVFFQINKEWVLMNSQRREWSHKQHFYFKLYVNNFRNYIRRSTISWWVNGSINSKIFSKFIRNLKEFVMKKMKLPQDKVLLILDNSSIHKSKSMRRLYLGFKVIFLPAYAPELAPIEKYFSIIKSCILKQVSGIQLNWRSNNAMEKLRRMFMKTTREDIIHLWTTLIKEMNNWLENLDDII